MFEEDVLIARYIVSSHEDQQGDVKDTVIVALWKGPTAVGSAPVCKQMAFSRLMKRALMYLPYAVEEACFRFAGTESLGLLTHHVSRATLFLHLSPLHSSAPASSRSSKTGV